jgi:cytochrome P450
MHAISFATKQRSFSNPPASRSRLRNAFSTAIGLLKYRVTCWVVSDPYVLRVLFGFLRCVRPVAIFFRKLVVVTKYRNVRDILDRVTDFSISEFMAPNMPWGPFLLSLDWVEQHNSERQRLQRAVCHKKDVEKIKEKVKKKCDSVIEAKQAEGEIDFVADLCAPIMIEIISEYFGIPILPIFGDAQEMTGVLNDVASFILVEPPAYSARANRAYASMATLTKAVHKQIEEIVQGGPKDSSGNLLSRLVKALGEKQGDEEEWFGKDWIRQYINGIAVAGSATVARASTHAIDRLLAHRSGLEEARKLVPVPEGHHADDLDKHLLQIIYEALRFRPMIPLVVRYCPRETIIAKGTDHARVAPAGTAVVVAAVGANFDPDKFANPSHFDTNRPLNNYIPFSLGSRDCWGKFVADVIMVEIIRSVLRLPNLRRAFACRGRVHYDGPAVTSLRLKFGTD